MEKLPTEILCLIALSVSDTKSLLALCSTIPCLRTFIRTHRFRIEWLSTRHPAYANLFSRHQTAKIESAHITKSSANVLADATALGVRLSLSSWRAYASSWLRERCGPSRTLPIRPEDGETRDAFVIHAWHEFIPLFMRTWLMPPLFDGNRWVRVSDPDANGLCRVGPEFNNLFFWFLTKWDRDVAYFDDPKNTRKDLTKNVLSEGLLAVIGSDGLSHAFRPGWIDGMLDLAFHDLPRIWKRWIASRGHADWVFDECGMQECRTAFKTILQLFSK